jgi:hypothetical protein
VNRAVPIDASFALRVHQLLILTVRAHPVVALAQLPLNPKGCPSSVVLQKLF